MIRIIFTPGCREWFVQETGRLFSLKGFQKTYKPDVLFDEFVVVDTEYSSKMRFWFSLNFLEVGKKTIQNNYYETIHSLVLKLA